MGEFLIYVGIVVFWMVVVLPWYHLRMRQGTGQAAPRKARTTTLKPKPTVNMPAPVGKWWQRRVVRWF